MATRANTSVARKEKVTPSSNSRTHHKPTNNAIGGAATAANKVKTTTSTISSPSARPVPNYLRHTSSSTKSDSLTFTKKTINEDSAHNVGRRRSFDRPPSATRSHKSLVSPDPKDRVLSRERQLAARSSSFSSSSSPKVPASSKPILERNSKSLKPIRPHQQGSTWRSSSFSKTTSLLRNGRNISSSNSTKSSTNGNLEETKQEIETKESFVQEANNVESEDDHMQKVEIKEDIILDNSQQGTENIDDGTVAEDDGEVNTSNCSIQNLNLIEGSSEILDEKHENESHEDEINDTVEQEENQEKEESSHIVDQGAAEEGIAAEIEPGEEENENENAIENSVPGEVDEKKNEEIRESKEVEEIAVVEEAIKSEEKESKNGVQKGQGNKRESPAAYNDVIEETKNKLLEKRKNKVKALVGAFETVIDYETAGSNK